MAITVNSGVMTKVALIAGVVLVVGALGAAIVYALTRPSHDDFQTARTGLVAKASNAQAKLAPAFDAYQVSFKQTQNETSSIQKATAAAAKELKSYEDAESAARQALKDLKNSRAANDSATGTAVSQYVDASEEYIDYFTSLINSYAKFQVLFASNEKICIDILVGDTSSLADRRDKVKAALKDCYPAVARLKESGNATYLEYAMTLENRLKDLETNSVTVAKGEQDYKQFEAEQKDLEAKLAALPAGTSSDEYTKLQKQVDDLNQKIKDSQSEFESAASKYKSTVEGLSGLYGDVFKTNVPKRADLLSSLVDARKNTLIVVLDGKLLDK